jgi:hypothetical protein
VLPVPFVFPMVIVTLSMTFWAGRDRHHKTSLSIITGNTSERLSLRGRSDEAIRQRGARNAEALLAMSAGGATALTSPRS